MIQPAPDTHRAADFLARIACYYAAFNDRRFDDAAALISDDAVIEQVPFACRERGGAAYRMFAETWTRAFPDVAVTIVEVVERAAGIFEVELLGKGTHEGPLAMGGCVFKPTGVKTTLRLRELLEFRGDLIAVSCLSFDLQELAHQLARVDDTQLLMHLSRLRYLEDQLRGAPRDSARHREVIDGIGRELDAARRIARPYFVR